MQPLLRAKLLSRLESRAAASVELSTELAVFLPFVSKKFRYIYALTLHAHDPADLVCHINASARLIRVCLDAT